jgi:hypothetical protein
LRADLAVGNAVVLEGLIVRTKFTDKENQSVDRVVFKTVQVHRIDEDNSFFAPWVPAESPSPRKKAKLSMAELMKLKGKKVTRSSAS